ncbi:MAG: hypothetical protein ACTHLE_03990 [Agriterribacter sp.]
MEVFENPLFITLIVVFVLGALALFIFFLLTLQRTLEAIDISSRTMRPGLVWLTLIPLFSLIWQFIMVTRISESIKNECDRLHIPPAEPKPTYSAGITMAVLSLAALIPAIGTFISLLSIVAMIIYWRKVNSYKNLILANRDNFLFDAEREAAGIVD